MRRLSVVTERWPIAGAFTISRGSRTEVVVVVATIEDGAHRGRGECVPYARYGETPEGVSTAIAAQADAIVHGAGRADLASAMKPGAARNALDCALWDLEAKISGRPAWQLAGLAQAPAPLTTCYTLSVGTPDAMREAARQAAGRPLLKVKLAGAGDVARIAAVRDGAPAARLVADANEAWDETNFAENMAACAAAGVEMIEQPLPADRDGALSRLPRPIPVCADESIHGLASLERLAALYDAVNIKLDKTGGLTEALALVAAARKAQFRIMAGCMVATSLSMAPAMLAAQYADIVDLDGALLLARDRPDALLYDGARVFPPTPALWG